MTTAMIMECTRRSRLGTRPVAAQAAKAPPTADSLRAIISFGPFPGNEAPESGVHTAILDDVPEDTDVFHVLQRTPRVPQLIVTNAFVYRIVPDGAIQLLGTREDVLGR